MLVPWSVVGVVEDVPEEPEEPEGCSVELESVGGVEASLVPPPEGGVGFEESPEPDEPEESEVFPSEGGVEGLGMGDIENAVSGTT